MDPVGCLGLDTVMQAGGLCVGDDFNDHRWETLAVSTEGALMVGKPGRDLRPGLGCTSLRDQRDPGPVGGSEQGCRTWVKFLLRHVSQLLMRDVSRMDTRMHCEPVGLWPLSVRERPGRQGRSGGGVLSWTLLGWAARLGGAWARL